MEDIKSSKQESSKTDLNGDDSDADSATINSSISDDFNEAIASTSAPTPTHQPIPRVNNTDSESDLDSEPFCTAETDSTKKSTTNKKRSAADAILTKMHKTKEEFRPHGKSLLRRRKRGSTPPVRPSHPKDSEIESGVEITEEMSLSPAAVEKVKSDEAEKSTNDSNEILTNDKPPINDIIAQPTLEDADCSTHTKSLLQYVFNYRGLLFVLITAFSCYFFDIPPFIQGILTCLCSMISFSNVCEAIGRFINQSLSKTLSGFENKIGSPERGSFAIPNYDKMPVCTVPPVGEHKLIKAYWGWMNEINNYDPTNYHISMTRSVFVRLDGSQLSISSTKARVPKRSIWNEQPIDIKSITFTNRRSYDLIGAHIEMCPKGLARKR